MTIHTTTNYGVAYIDVDTPLVQLADASRQAALTIDAALGRGGIAPPDATTQAQLAARALALEQRATTLEAPPVAFLRQTTAQTGLPKGWNTLNLQAEDLDTHGGHADTSSGDQTRYTIPRTGIYAVEGVVEVNTTSTALMLQARLLVNGVAPTASKGPGGVMTSTAFPTMAGTGRQLRQLTAGQYLQLQGYVDGAGWYTSTSADGGSWLSVEFVR